MEIITNAVDLACARLSDSIRGGNVLKAKLRRARLGKGGGGGGKNAALSLSSPRAFFAFLITERLSTTISEPGTGYGRLGSYKYDLITLVVHQNIC